MTDRVQGIRQTLVAWATWLWEGARPPIAFAASALTGLMAATFFAAYAKGLLSGAVSMTYWIRDRLPWISSDFAPKAPGDVTSIVDLGFGILGGTVVIALIRDVVRDGLKIVPTWRTSTLSVLVAPMVTVWIGFFALGLSVYGLDHATRAAREPQVVSFNSHNVLPAGATPDGILTFFVQFEEDGGLDTIREFSTHRSIHLSDSDASNLKRFGAAMSRCRESDSDGDVAIELHGFASSQYWVAAMSELRRLATGTQKPLADRASAVLSDMTPVVQLEMEDMEARGAAPDPVVAHAKAFNVYLALARAREVKRAILAGAEADALARPFADALIIKEWKASRDMEEMLPRFDDTRLDGPVDRGILTRSVAIKLMNAGKCGITGRSMAARVSIP